MPLSSRRNNSNFTSAVASTGFKLPQAPFPNGTHAQLLQHSTSKLHSPRISNGYATARPNCNAAPLSPRRSSDKHSSYKSGVTDTLQPGSSSQSIPAAATTSPRAKVFGLAQLQQLTQAQHQLFSPRHSKPAQQGSLTARPDGKQPYEVFGLSQYAQQGQAGWSRRPHQQPQQLPVTHKPPQQPVQPVPTASTPIRCRGHHQLIPFCSFHCHKSAAMQGPRALACCQVWQQTCMLCPEWCWRRCGCSCPYTFKACVLCDHWQVVSCVLTHAAAAATRSPSLTGLSPVCLASISSRPPQAVCCTSTTKRLPA